MYSLESIRASIEKVIAKEKLDEKTVIQFFSLLKAICIEILDPPKEEKETIIPNDLDAVLLSKVKETKVNPDKISIAWFFENSFNDILDSGSDYYRLRSELLEHSKILKEYPTSLDFLTLKTEEGV